MDNNRLSTNSSSHTSEEPFREALHSITNDSGEQSVGSYGRQLDPLGASATVSQRQVKSVRPGTGHGAMNAVNTDVSSTNKHEFSTGDTLGNDGDHVNMASGSRPSSTNASNTTTRNGTEPLHRVFHRASALHSGESSEQYGGQTMNRKVSTDVRLDGSVKFIHDWLSKRNGETTFSTVLEHPEEGTTAGNNSSQGNKHQTILRATIDSHSTDPSGSFTLYHIRVTDGKAEWTVRKRFREFSALHHTLHKRLPDHITEMLPRLPPKKIMGVLQPDFVKERLVACKAVVDLIFDLFAYC